MEKVFWVICVSKIPKEKRVAVKILSSEYVPARGERLAIVAKLGSEEECRLIRDQFGDEKIIDVWRRSKVIRLV